MLMARGSTQTCPLIHYPNIPISTSKMYTNICNTHVFKFFVFETLL